MDKVAAAELIDFVFLNYKHNAFVTDVQGEEYIIYTRRIVADGIPEGDLLRLAIRRVGSNSGLRFDSRTEVETWLTTCVLNWKK